MRFSCHLPNREKYVVRARSKQRNVPVLPSRELTLPYSPADGLEKIQPAKFRRRSIVPLDVRHRLPSPSLLLSRVLLPAGAGGFLRMQNANKERPAGL